MDRRQVLTSSEETRKLCASRTVRREPTVSGLHTQPTRATQGRGQGKLRGSLSARFGLSSTNLQGAGCDPHLPAANRTEEVAE